MKQHAGKRSETPELDQFAGFVDVAKFQLSAIFEVVEEDGAEVQVEGAPVLVEKVKALLQAPVSAKVSSRKQLRVPEVSLKGRDAERLGFEAIKAYSIYVGALFDNFD
jgi:hypothetical protein